MLWSIGQLVTHSLTHSRCLTTYRLTTLTKSKQSELAFHLVKEKLSAGHRWISFEWQLNRRQRSCNLPLQDGFLMEKFKITSRIYVSSCCKNVMVHLVNCCICHIIIAFSTTLLDEWPERFISITNPGTYKIGNLLQDSRR